MPRDRFGREIDYLRISVIDHCNLRCVYCMPLGGHRDYAPSDDLLTPDEIATVARIAIAVGFRRIRLTGGEPTLRPDLVDIVARVACTPGLTDVALTTNGILLPRLAPALAAVGLKRVNVHLDTLDPGRLAAVMRYGSLDEIWAGIAAAEAAGLRPIKLNAVVVRGYNEDDVAALAALTWEHDWHVRFIELMPLGVGEPATVSRRCFVSNDETRTRIEAVCGALTALPVADAADESRNYRLTGAQGTVGFISPVSQPYCGTCNRMRLTADGKFHLCLLNDDERDVRAAVRRGDDAAIAGILLEAVGAKPVGHHLRTGRTIEQREMFQLGG
jgi:cyclic pyranopterin phosphate synthase